jgi:hypothetical protein
LKSSHFSQEMISSVKARQSITQSKVWSRRDPIEYSVET